MDDDLFDCAQALLARRAATSTKVAPTPSTYTLGGKVICHECHRAYIGAGAHNQNSFYRYYICRNQQNARHHGCTGVRIPADEIEEAVLEQLLDIMSDYDFFERAASAALAEVANDRPRLEAEKASTDAQPRETVAALTRYLRAF